MSVRFDAEADVLKRTGGLGLTSNTFPYTFAAWICRRVDRNSFSASLCLTNGTTSFGDQITTDAGGDVVNYEHISGGDPIAGPTLTINGWFFVAGTATATTKTLYWRADGAGSLSSAQDTSINTAPLANLTQLWVGDVPWSGEWFNGSVCCARVWNAALNSTELLAESNSATPVRTSGLQGAWRLASATDLADTSGNGRNLTGAGHATDTDEPADIGTASVAGAGTPSGAADGAAGVGVFSGDFPVGAGSPTAASDAAAGSGVFTAAGESVNVGADISVTQGAPQTVRAVSTSGFATTPTLTADQSNGSPLPSGVSFVDNANGTGQLTLNHTTVGTWTLRVTGVATTPVTYGPRVTPGVAGADDNPNAGGLTIIRLAAGIYNNFSVTANRLVLPQVGASVTLTGQTSFGAGSRLYGVTLNSQGASWAALIDNNNVTIEQCNFAGNPGIEHIRARRLGVLIKACRFTGSPTNHDIKIDGRTTHTGAGTVADCAFAGTPVEDHIQPEGVEAATVLEHNVFTGKAGEDAIDIKAGATVTVRGHDFTTAGFTGEALLMQNGGPGSNIAEDNRFGSGCFHSYGAHPEDTSVTGRGRRNIYLSGSTLRLRRSTGIEINDCEFTGAQVRLGTSTANDFPANAHFHHNAFHNLTIVVSNASSTTITNDNTYSGTTSGTFPGPQGGND